MTTPPLPPSSQPPRKERSGCLLALYIVLGVGAVLLVVTVVGLFLFARSETGQRLITTAREGITLAQEAQRAPGTDALRAAGCSQAMVMPMGRMLELVGEVAPQASAEIRGASELRDDTFVFCELDTETHPDLECSDIARIYGEAVPNAPERFGVAIQPERGRETKCSGSYGRDGTLIEPLEDDPPQ